VKLERQANLVADLSPEKTCIFVTHVIDNGFHRKVGEVELLLSLLPVLPLVQHRAPPLRHSLYDAAECLLQTGNADPRNRSVTMNAAFEAHPKRFKGKRLTLNPLHEAEWIIPRSTTVQNNRRLLRLQ
jgi:hypothetical protein